MTSPMFHQGHAPRVMPRAAAHLALGIALGFGANPASAALRTVAPAAPTEAPPDVPVPTDAGPAHTTDTESAPADATAPPDALAPADAIDPDPAEPSALEATTPPMPRPVAAVHDAPPAMVADPCRRDGQDRCRRIKVGGAITTALGLAALGVGIGLAATRDQPIDGRPAYSKNYRAAGVMAVSVGVILTVAGALVLREGGRLERRRPALARRLAGWTSLSAAGRWP